MPDVSPTTGEAYYSGTWEDVRNLCKVLKIGSGRLALIDQKLVEFYQEQVDREIDGELEQYYYVPLRSYNMYRPVDSTTISVFPGAIRSLARHWAAGALLMSEFQDLDPNANEGATTYITESKQKLYDFMRFQKRIPGQTWKHNLRTMPPTMAPGFNPEPEW